VMKRDFPSLLLYAFGFMLMWEWLRPMETLTNTRHIGLFLGFLALALFLSYLQMKWTWQTIMKVGYIFVSINRFHYHEGLFHLNWLATFLTNAIYNTGLLVDRDWIHVSNEFRTFLLFLLLWLMVYLLQYWLLRRQSIFLFFLLTLIYVTVLDTFTPYSAKAAIVRTVVAGFTMTGMLAFYRMIQKEKLPIRASFMRKWMVPLGAMLAVSVLTALFAPKAAAVWPDPVPYLKAAAQPKNGNDQGNLGPKRIGYGMNDDRLGGPFIGNNNPVFMYEAADKTYWKVETKDVYTGKGWIPSGATSTSFREGDLVPVYPIPDTVDTDKRVARVFFTKNFYTLSFLMYPAGVQRIDQVEPQGPKPFEFQMDNVKEKISSNSGNVFGYLVNYKMPKYKAVDLRKTTELPSSLNEKFYEKYTQLPQGLPPRIKELTEKITAGQTNWYDKAKAVETYLSGPDYTYDQKNVAVPGKNDDYVDQFLFKTKRGYCDNFSTSMAVMLRSIGIPTRWVKGYTGGDFHQYSNGNIAQSIYQVTNNNAHSWVEVFLPNVGWVPFEPTKGYSNDLVIQEDTTVKNTNTQAAMPAPVKRFERQPRADDTKNDETKTQSVTLKDVWNKIQLFVLANWERMVFVLVLVAAAAGILYRIRGKWFPYLLLARYRFKKKDDTISSAYLILLSQLERFGLKRKKQQTLRSYAHEVDTFFSTKAMTRLTNYYEQFLYQQKLPAGCWEEVRELWENLIKKTIA